MKNRHLDERGIKLIRVREAPLTKLSEHDLIIPMGSFISKKTMNLIVEFVGAESLTDYLKKEAFVAEETYLAYLDYFPSPVFTRTVIYVFRIYAFIEKRMPHGRYIGALIS